MIGLGLALVVLDVYRNAPDTWWLPILATASLRALARPLRVLIFGGIGLGLVILGMWGFNRALLGPFVRPGRPLLDQVTSYRRRGRGPRIVAIGGGNGLASLLRDQGAHTTPLPSSLWQTMAALVSYAGKWASCLRATSATASALSDDEELTTQLFKYRFGEAAGLNGHSLGNLLISALAEITGSFEAGVAESARVLAIRGRLYLPRCMTRLIADLQEPERNREICVKGESNIPTTPGRVKRVWLEPSNPLAYPPALQAILSADLICVGPAACSPACCPICSYPILPPRCAPAGPISSIFAMSPRNQVRQIISPVTITCGRSKNTLESEYSIWSSAITAR